MALRPDSPSMSMGMAQVKRSPGAIYPLPTKPELSLAVYLPSSRPLQQPAPLSPAQTSSLLSHHDSVISQPYSPRTSAPASAQSIRSASTKYGRESMSPSEPERGMYSIDRRSLQYPQPAASRDPEKRIVLPSSPTSVSGTRSYHANPETGIAAYDDDESMELQSKAARILIYLSTFCPLISIALLFWTLAALFLSILLIPLRLILSTKLPGLSSLLLPPLRLQLRLIYSSWIADEAFEVPRNASPLLVIIHLFSPAVAPLVALASWVVAVFWFFSAVLGDPAGKDGHNDGRAAVLAVRNWWEGWLIRGLR